MEKFIYKIPAEKGSDYDLISKGPDREEGTSDDITNWDEEEEEE